MFCSVDIGGGISNAFVVPRTALHDGNTVYLLEEGRLARRQVQVTHFRYDEAIISAGLQAGDRLVVSVLSAPVVSMKLRPLEDRPRLRTARGRRGSRRQTAGIKGSPAACGENWRDGR